MPNIEYGKIVITVFAPEDEINENELALSDKFEEALRRVEETLKYRQFGKSLFPPFTFEIEDE